MKPTGNLDAAGLAARHSAELLRGARPAADPLKALARLGDPLAEGLAHALAGLCAGRRPDVRPGGPVDLPAGSIDDRRGEPVRNSLLGIGAREHLVTASIPERAVAMLVDLAFGGTGAIRKPADPKTSGGNRPPLSLDLMFGRFETKLATPLANALDLADEGSVKPLTRAGGPEASSPLAGCKRSVLPLEIAFPGCEPWELALAFPAATLAALARPDGARADGSKAPAARLAAEPFAGIALPLNAVLVDMAVPVSVLSRLAPGQVIPVSVARNVPLRMGGRVIAHGTVGAMDDRAALQLIQIQTTKEN